MEYAQEGDLLQKILKKKEKKESFEETFIWKVMISVLNGLKRLHSKKIIHRDLKVAVSIIKLECEYFYWWKGHDQNWGS